MGKLSDSRYLKLSCQYEKRQAEIEQFAIVLEREIEAQAGQFSDVNEFLKLVEIRIPLKIGRESLNESEPA